MARKIPTTASTSSQRGAALILLVVAMLVGFGVLFGSRISTQERRLSADLQTDLALKEAKAALLSFAVTWPKKKLLGTAGLDLLGQKRGPGFLPCPDANNSGASVSNCGNEAGSNATGQLARLGRLPWRTLGLADLRDGAGERLWYAVSSKYKATDGNFDLNPDTGLGTITVRDSIGNVTHDGTNLSLLNAQHGGVVAVIIAPGAPITRWENAAGTTKTIQDRGCSGPGCTAAGWCMAPEETVPKCNPVNFLEKAPGVPGEEDNSNFVDRNDVRSGNGDGFIQGPVTLLDGTVLVNDRMIVITYNEIMQAMMKRVALEVENCMASYALVNGGRYPYPAPTCRSGYANALRWSDRDQTLFGRVPDPPFDTTAADSGGTMQDNWNASTLLGCTLGNSATEPAARWWDAWKDFTFIAIADNHRPGSGVPAACSASGCLQVIDAGGGTIAADRQFAVIVGGNPQGAQVHAGGSPAAPRLASNYLEGTNVALEGMNTLSGISECSDMGPHPPPCSPLATCNRVTASPRSQTFNDAVAFYPRQ